MRAPSSDATIKVATAFGSTPARVSPRSFACLTIVCRRVSQDRSAFATRARRTGLPSSAYLGRDAKYFEERCDRPVSSALLPQLSARGRQTYENISYKGNPGIGGSFSLLSFMDCFRVIAWLTLAAVPLLLFVRRFKPAGKSPAAH
jgi:hypothetical protein